jgi:hypothetical protein
VELVIEADEVIKDVEVLEPPALEKDLAEEDEKELESMDTSEDAEGELEMLAEFEELSLSFEESRVIAGKKGMKVVYWGKVRRIAKRTCIEPSPSPKCPSEESDDSGYKGDREMNSPKRARGFWRGP